MTQESQSQSFTKVSPLNDTGDIRHNKRTIIPVIHDSQVRYQRCKRIIGNLRFRCRHHGQQGRFSGIRESHQSHVGKYFQLHNHGTLHARFPGLRITRCLIRGRTEIPVSKTTSSSANGNSRFTVPGNLTNRFTRVRIPSHCPERHVHDYIFPVRPCTQITASTLPVAREHVTLEFQVNQCPIITIPTQNHVTAASSISPVRPAFSGTLIPVQMHGARSPGSATTENFHVIDKVR